MSNEFIWLIVGLVFFLAELFGASGAGLLFLGMGAFAAGGLIGLGLIADDQIIIQWAVFGISSLIFALLLWKPLKKLRSNKQQGGYKNIVGDTAYVSSATLTKKDGEVTWSGTIMKARLEESCSVDSLPSGTQVTIVDINGVTLMVRP